MNDSVRIFAAAVILAMPGLAEGDALAEGLGAYDVGDYEKSLTLCQPLADQGVAAAQFCVGRLYANGFGVPMDDAQALKWYGLAAGQGHAEAQFNLGVMHANGWGVPMNDDEAAKWYRQAAESGQVQAQMAFAAVLREGRGVAQSNQQAYMWYRIAADLGDTAAISNRDDMAEKLTAPEREAADGEAAAWLKRLEDDPLRVGQVE
ncbi:MAG: tetratricopeptide repeat protein [Woeseiaceae bacterium]|nr:tetratricopeptide repeat protein [Woeseiaceae bacterium]